jgi:CBS domain-containing protein
MKVSEIMNPRPVTVDPETMLRDVVQIMLRHHLNDVLIVSGETLLGIVTYKDIFRKLLPGDSEVTEHAARWTDPDSIEDRLLAVAALPAREIMTTRLYTVDPKATAIRAGSMMNVHRVKQLPVVDKGRLVGIVSYTDITWGLMVRYYKGSYYRKSDKRFEMGKES